MSETKTARPSDRNQSGVPSSYVFRSRGATKKLDPAMLSSSRLTSVPSSSAGLSLKNCPPQTYQYKRLQFDKHDDSDHGMLNRTSIDKASLIATRAEEERRSRFENVPKSYQMKSSYKREDPPASHKMFKEEKAKTTLQMQTHRRSIPKGCDCWFYLYNGYCGGHRSDSKSYFNLDPYSSNERLTKWTRSPLLASEQYQGSNGEHSTVSKSNSHLNYKSGKKYDVKEHFTGEEDFGDENVLYDG